ncbi:MAG: THUMP domain-containing class I SAM-dependent RNA methyltransferase [Planctomycetales bacterium]
MSNTFHLTARLGFGLEAVVSRELKSLGFEDLKSEDGRVHFSGGVDAIVRANLWLRSADRIVLQLGEFTAMDFGELFDRTRDLPWEEWLPRDAEFPVTGRSSKSQLHSVPDCQRIVKKAIVERLRSAYDVDWFEETGPLYPIEVSVLKDNVKLTIDTSGAGLNKRGYRKLTAAAPLRETLAAAMVQLSVWNPDRPFVDPFCGSGTIPIEAAMIATNRAPGLNRSFACTDWPQIEDSVWEHAWQEAKDLMKPAPEELLIGTDVDPVALGMARYHANRAGVGELVHFQQRPFHELSSQKKYGCVITNPPYGERLGEAEEIERLYSSMAGVFSKLDTWSFFVLTAYSDFQKSVRRQSTRRRKLYNAKIACTLHQLLGPRPPRRTLGQVPPDEVDS